MSDARSRPRTLLTVVPLVVVLGAGAAACGNGAHGQENALDACKSFGNASGGGLTPAVRNDVLNHAQQLADEAAKKGPQWQALADGISGYRAAVASGRTGTAALKDDRATIDGACDLAARGY